MHQRFTCLLPRDWALPGGYHLAFSHIKEPCSLRGVMGRIFSFSYEAIIFPLTSYPNLSVSLPPHSHHCTLILFIPFLPLTAWCENHSMCSVKMILNKISSDYKLVINVIIYKDHVYFLSLCNCHLVTPFLYGTWQALMFSLRTGEVKIIP